MSENRRRDFSHCIRVAEDVKPCSVNQSMLNVFVVIITANTGVWCMTASNLLNETVL